MKGKTLSVSLLSVEMSQLGRIISELHRCGTNWFHFDIMDGCFVEKKTYGAKSLHICRSSAPDCVFDAHLMVRNPYAEVEEFAAAGADYITFHIESESDAEKTIERIHRCGKRAGIALSPDTPVEKIEGLLNKVELVLVMTVQPGYGGQALILRCVDKISELEELRRERGLDFLISVDGGIKEQNVSLVTENGADIFVAGSAVFADVPEVTVPRLKKASLKVTDK